MLGTAFVVSGGWCAPLMGGRHVVCGHGVVGRGVGQHLPALPVLFLAVFEQVILVAVIGLLDEELVLVLFHAEPDTPSRCLAWILRQAKGER